MICDILVNRFMYEAVTTQHPVGWEFTRPCPFQVKEFFMNVHRNSEMLHYLITEPNVMHSCNPGINNIFGTKPFAIGQMRDELQVIQNARREISK